MRRDSSFCAKSVRYNIFTNGDRQHDTRAVNVTFAQCECHTSIYCKN